VLSASTPQLFSPLHQNIERELQLSNLKARLLASSIAEDIGSCHVETGAITGDPGGVCAVTLEQALAMGVRVYSWKDLQTTMSAGLRMAQKR
jgi:hypothetical protein